MSPRTPAAERRRPRTGGGLPRICRYLYRIPLLLVHVLVSLPLTVLCLVPMLARLPWGAETVGDRAVRAWSAGLMRIFGFRLRRIGTPRPGPVLFVANHVSWIDIEALHSQRMMGFVAKREIADWPVVGWLAARGQSIFHARGSTDSLNDVVEVMARRLQSGFSVGVFPEGRTRAGDQVGPFHARIFTAAVQAQVPVQPVALRYGEDGAAQTVVAFGPREHFGGNFLRLLGEPARSAEVHFLEPILPGEVDGRRRIAALSRERIVAVMGQRGGHGLQQDAPQAE